MKNSMKALGSRWANLNGKLSSLTMSLALGAAGVIGSMGTLGTLSAGMLGAAPSARAGHVSHVVTSASSEDELILKSGKILKGELIEESETEVKFRIMIGSLSAVRTYPRSEVLAVTRGSEGGEAQAEPTDSSQSASMENKDSQEGPSVYVMDLKGEWGRDISVPPIREMLKDAKQYHPDIVVIVLDNLFEDELGNDFADDKNPRFDIFAAEEIEPLFTHEVPVDWGYEPRWVVWVKNAMGGAALLPFNFKEIYFAPEGRMGGLGYLVFSWGNMGDKVVREKQLSLRLGHIEGMAIRGGYDPRIIRAMSEMRMEMCYSMEGGKAVLHTRLPESPSETLLTDNGTLDEYRDDMQSRVRGNTNDALTLKADLAQVLGVSKGTVSSMDELMWELGYERDAKMLPSKSDRIAESWKNALVRAERQMPRLMRDFSEIQVQGDYNERRSARSRQIAKLEQLIRLIRKYDGVLNPRRYGVPAEPQLQVQIETIKQEQIKDRR